MKFATYARSWIAKSRPILGLEFVNSRPLEHEHSDTCNILLLNKTNVHLYKLSNSQQNWDWYLFWSFFGEFLTLIYTGLFFSSKEPYLLLHLFRLSLSFWNHTVYWILQSVVQLKSVYRPAMLRWSKIWN